ncbi:MAG TPA: LLM class flavin-dependent oxidoreductase, partial [Baekduia sp.]|nr:LLM class flavin-dependent oxidoreductase [Baekduia sp.]
LGLQQPVRLARAAATVDHLSDGRLDLGLGLGVRELPHSAFAVPSTDRVERFEDYVKVLRLLWTGTQVEFTGSGIELQAARIEPEPMQTPLPIWFGAGAEPALRRTALMADAWIGSGATTTAECAQQVARLCELLSEAGRDPDEFPMSKRAYIAIDRPQIEVDAWFSALYDGWPPPPEIVLRGSADAVTEQLIELGGAGVDELLIHPAGEDRAQLEVIAADILPALRDA